MKWRSVKIYYTSDFIVSTAYQLLVWCFVHSIIIKNLFDWWHFLLLFQKLIQWTLSNWKWRPLLNIKRSRLIKKNCSITLKQKVMKSPVHERVAWTIDLWPKELSKFKTESLPSCHLGEENINSRQRLVVAICNYFNNQNKYQSEQKEKHANTQNISKTILKMQKKEIKNS